MARVLVLVWSTHRCLSAMHPAYTRDWLWRRKLLKNNNNKYKKKYSPWEVHQAILPSVHTPLIGVSTLHLHCSTSMVLLWYSIILLFLFFSSATLCLSASSWVFFSASLLAFWAACSAWCNFTTSSSWTRSCYSSSYLHCISCCCFSRISALFCEISEWAEEDMAIQRQEQKKLLFSFIYCWPRHYHGIFR